MERSSSGAAPRETMEGGGSGAVPDEMMERSGSRAAPRETMEGSDSGAAPDEMNPPAPEQGAGLKRFLRTGHPLGLAPKKSLALQAGQTASPGVTPVSDRSGADVGAALADPTAPVVVPTPAEVLVARSRNKSQFLCEQKAEWDRLSEERNVVANEKAGEVLKELEMERELRREAESRAMALQQKVDKDVEVVRSLRAELNDAVNRRLSAENVSIKLEKEAAYARRALQEQL
ncbi:uncharacterized protein [Miscanthus floridulus]|uniref:uncharacterized protein n=1 Tax=Miscanthus floridulus TaxID=154761 RepID=UPI00345B0DFF